jgi:hypothetical protein
MQILEIQDHQEILVLLEMLVQTELVQRQEILEELHQHHQ